MGNNDRMIATDTFACHGACETATSNVGLQSNPKLIVVRGARRLSPPQVRKSATVHDTPQ